MPDKPTVAVLGTGIMGAPMATRLVEAGLEVRVWNRTADKTTPVVDRGAILADTPATAASGADFVLTMLADGPTVESVMTGENGALATMPRGAVWLQTSTIGLAYTDRLAAAAAAAGVGFVDSPVLGTRAPAEQGKLVVLAGGEPELVERARPVYEAIGGRTVPVGGIGAASRLKLVANSWVLAVTNGTAEAIALANELGVDPQLFLDSISGGLLDCAYTHFKGKQMVSDEYELAFPANLAAKDARLILDAVDDRVDLGGVRATLAHLEATDRLGNGGDDMASLYRAVVAGKAS